MENIQNYQPDTDTALGMINNINIQQVSATMQKIAQFQSVVQQTLKQNHDFGIVPGTSKPTLLKPGAEKILMLLGLSSEYDIIEKIQDYDTGFFAYTVRCTLTKNGTVVTQGLGHCNSKERKYTSTKQDLFMLGNTCLKMAKKRAQVDATLTVAALSEVFTQDMEDMDLTGQEIQRPQPQKPQNSYSDNSSVISQKQAKRMFAIAGGNEDLVRNILEKYGYERSADVKRSEYEEICSEIESAKAALDELGAEEIK